MKPRQLQRTVDDPDHWDGTQEEISKSITRVLSQVLLWRPGPTTLNKTRPVNQYLFPKACSEATLQPSGGFNHLQNSQAQRNRSRLHAFTTVQLWVHYWLSLLGIGLCLKGHFLLKSIKYERWRMTKNWHKETREKMTKKWLQKQNMTLRKGCKWQQKRTQTQRDKKTHKNKEIL